MNITSGNMELLSRVLSVASMRHDVIAQNIANVNTPGFHTLQVNFEEALREAMDAGNAGSLHTLSPQITLGAGGVERVDGNNVDIDQEVNRLQKNTLLFKVYTQLMATQIAQYRSAISGH
ncbi:MAG TPA: flagellar basal body rod protein FlgB [Gemmataceae bacterium]|nr:flagellar basal body rod protein FlgB [Gemmataceae bacterium]